MGLLSDKIKLETSVLNARCNSCLYGDLLILQVNQASISNKIRKILKAESGNAAIIELAEVAEKLDKNLELFNHDTISYFRSLLFIDLLASTEDYLSKIMKVIVSEYPKKIGKSKFELSEILEKSESELISKALDKYLNDLTYKKSDDVLKEFCQIVSIDPKLLKPFWSGFIEAKSRRDLGLHNSWICNSIYLRKTREVGIESTYSVGDILIPKEHDYLLQSIQNIRDMANMIEAKALDVFS